MVRCSLLVLLMLAMAATACGDGDTATRPPSTPAPATANASATSDTPDPIVTVTVASTPDGAGTTPKSTPQPPLSGETGIAGTVTVGPACPVEREDSPCPDRPLAARITVWRGATLVAETRSGDDGGFRILIDPGEYRVVGESENVFPAGGEQTVTVTPGAITTISVRYDSGIR